MGALQWCSGAVVRWWLKGREGPGRVWRLTGDVVAGIWSDTPARSA